MRGGKPFSVMLADTASRIRRALSFHRGDRDEDWRPSGARNARTRKAKHRCQKPVRRWKAEARRARK